ncbi:hypothetical protein EVAR_100431_1 [Eumeta japonica]|uniref:Uncharacterized protein n=1 Tax=Eumeta variegata TaxID=151549 RepID=A0A4C2A1B0_EUMVA|nr:hypothetical protein EVAR_100431_1 [Eumeta japonica]
MKEPSTVKHCDFGNFNRPSSRHDTTRHIGRRGLLCDDEAAERIDVPATRFVRRPNNEFISIVIGAVSDRRRCCGRVRPAAALRSPAGDARGP